MQFYVGPGDVISSGSYIYDLKERGGFTKISGNYFTYDGVQSRQYGLRILHINTSEETRSAGEIEYSTVFNRATKRLSIQGRNWDTSSISFETEIISEKPLSRLEQSEIQSWLFNRPAFARFYPEETNRGETTDVGDTYIECVFYNPTAIIFAGGVFGWKCQCMTSSPMAIQEMRVENLTDIASQTVTVNVETDINDYVYPIMEITAGVSGGTLQVVNLSDQYRSFEVIDVPSSITMYVDNALGTITDDTGNSLYSQLTGRRFFRLLPGVNELQFNDNVKSVNLYWHNARWFR